MGRKLEQFYMHWLRRLSPPSNLWYTSFV